MRKNRIFAKSLVLSIVPCIIIAIFVNRIGDLSFVPFGGGILSLTRTLNLAVATIAIVLFGLAVHAWKIFSVPLTTVFAVSSLCAGLFVQCVSTQRSISFLAIDGIHVFICSCLNVLDMCLLPGTYALVDINGIVPHVLRHRNSISGRSVRLCVITNVLTLFVVVTFVRRLWVLRYLLYLSVCSYLFYLCVNLVQKIFEYNFTLVCVGEKRKELADVNRGEDIPSNTRFFKDIGMNEGYTGKINDNLVNSIGTRHSMTDSDSLHNTPAKLSDEQINSARIAFLSLKDIKTLSPAEKKIVQHAYETELVHLSNTIKEIRAEEKLYIERLWKKSAVIVKNREVPSQLTNTESIHVNLVRSHNIFEVSMAWIRKKVMAVYFQRLCTDSIYFIEKYHMFCYSDIASGLLFELQSAEIAFNANFCSNALLRSVNAAKKTPYK